MSMNDNWFSYGLRIYAPNYAFRSCIFRYFNASSPNFNHNSLCATFDGSGFERDGLEWTWSWCRRMRTRTRAISQKIDLFGMRNASRYANLICVPSAVRVSLNLIMFSFRKRRNDNGRVCGRFPLITQQIIVRSPLFVRSVHSFS